MNEKRLPPGYYVLWVITVVSLLLNVLTIGLIARLRETARIAVDDAVTVISAFQEETLSYTFSIDETVEINTDIPINETIPVNVDEDFEIDTTVQVPIGGFDFDVPIQTTIPIEFQTEVVIDRSFPVRAAVPIALDVPIEIEVSETPLYDDLDEVEMRLRDLSERLNQPVIYLFGGGGADE